MKLQSVADRTYYLIEELRSPADFDKGQWFDFTRFSARLDGCFAGITTAMCSSYKSELALAQHNHGTAGNVFKVALIKVGPTGTYNNASTNYANITGNSDEVTGTAYSAGGFAFTNAQNAAPLNNGTGGIAYWGYTVNPSWAAASFSTTGCMYYDSTNGSSSVAVFDFGGTQTVTSGTFTIVQPATDAVNALLRIT